MTSPFVPVSELADALRSGTPPIVLDASMVLHPAAFDGDYRRESGLPLFLTAHIPGSQYVDVSTQFSDPQASLHYTHPDPQRIADELARIGVGEKTAVVVYDSTGTLWAARLWYLLRWIGVSVRVLDGGLDAWTAAGNGVESGPSALPTPVPDWEARTRGDFWVSKGELLERTEGDSRPLVCGLPATSFAGTAPSRYARRGHIPDSVNVSSRDLFAKDGTVKSRVEIVLAYDAAGVNVSDPDTEVLLYCGGGISASGSALTLASIGVTNVRMYDGSLEEWSADPNLPLIVG